MIRKLLRRLFRRPQPEPFLHIDAADAAEMGLDGQSLREYELVLNMAMHHKSPVFAVRQPDGVLHYEVVDADPPRH